ncbi:MAG: cytidylate kinase-like family protein [Paraprevotella sp.]|nr:cytidylate kinase-like family protein [Paraprevotella sp.]
MKTTEKFVINVGRQLGSGGRYIGERLAKAFDIKFYDKELLELAAQESGFNKKFFERTDEEHNLFQQLASAFPFLNSGINPYDNMLSSESLFKIQSDAIRKAAEQQSCVFVGRCADYILRDNPRCVNIFISANLNDRIKRICQLTGITETEAEKRIMEGDKRRAAYYNYYSAGEWGKAETYHLCINSSVLGLERTTEYIQEFITQKLML